jgi:hypothetical protein
MIYEAGGLLVQSVPSVLHFVQSVTYSISSRMTHRGQKFTTPPTVAKLDRTSQVQANRYILALRKIHFAPRAVFPVW